MWKHMLSELQCLEGIYSFVLMQAGCQAALDSETQSSDGPLFWVSCSLLFI